MVGASLTSSAGISPSARCDRRSANFSAVASSILGSALKMLPGDSPVTMAHVANATRSAASRGGTSALSASAMASWFMAAAALANSLVSAEIVAS
ncbi:Uncharacterised protein [Mycobacteroides abscessus subsp. abscessus]|nr:Uncharacterised protein [Mycobacteroides abscessus subsp. abscessus]SIM04037.1 Uncharacterised protein [Mycobacteroides abscessus subsp. abscessus]